MTQDPYSYPGTDVLRNLPGIKDPEQLADFEYKMVTLRELQQIDSPIEGKFDLKHLQDIHCHLFQDVYDWAGEIRTVGISKGGSSFAQPGQIENYANSTVFADLRKDNLLQGLDKEKFVDRLSHHFSEINALHPFREGNGRATRVFITELAKGAGYTLDFDEIDSQAWNEASRASFNGRMESIKEIFREIVEPNLDIQGPGATDKVSRAGGAVPEQAIAFQTLPMADALKKHPELEGAYADLRAIAEDIDPKLPEPAQQNMYAAAKETIGLQLESDNFLTVEPAEVSSIAMFVIEDTQTAAFQDLGRYAGIASVLVDAAEKLERGVEAPFALQDTNGNSIGRFEIATLPIELDFTTDGAVRLQVDLGKPGFETDPMGHLAQSVRHAAEHIDQHGTDTAFVVTTPDGASVGKVEMNQPSVEHTQRYGTQAELDGPSM